MSADQIPSHNPGEGREDMWGIKRRDRRWFQLFTLLGGVIGSAVLTWLELAYRADNATPNVVMRNILLGIGASFIAAGFLSWGLLHIKEVIVSIADWIRESTERRRQRLRDEVKQELLAELGLEVPEGAVLESPQPPKSGSRRDAYLEGYRDAQRGHPLNPPTEESDV